MSKFIVACGAEHYHSVAESELRVCNAARIIFNDKMSSESEGVAQPVYRGPGIVVPHRRNDRRDRFFGHWHRLNRWQKWADTDTIEGEVLSTKREYANKPNSKRHLAQRPANLTRRIQLELD